MTKDRLSLDDVEWGEFYIGGNDGLFNISATKSGIDKNKLNNEIGNIPYITRSDLQNGINLFVTDKQKSMYAKNDGNVLTIGLDTQTVFYQNQAFYTGQNIQILENDMLNKNIALFLIPLLKIQLKMFSWGSNGATLTRLKKTKILLPIDKNGKANWQFMEDYIKQEQKAIAQKVINYYEDKIIKTGFDLLGLEDAKWGNFRLKELFNIYTGRDIIISNIKEGKYPIVTHSIEKNGIGAYTQKLDNRRLFNHNNTLSLADRGNFYAYTQYHDFYIGTRVKALELKNDFCDKYILQFLATSINKQEVRFSYGFNATNKTDDIKILLPIDEKGEPHWDYMSKFMQKIEQEKLEKSLNYIYIY
ncbi:MAG: restriction endonuclease subunit S, partial [Fenollaria timonensis]